MRESKRTLRLAVVQLDLPPRAMVGSERLWAPTEPLPVELPVRGLFGVDGQALRDDLEAVATERARAKVREVLNVLRERDVDVAVFPEYLVPLSCLPDLVSYASDRAVVAGLELIRGDIQVDELRAYAQAGTTAPEETKGRNLAVLVANGEVHFVTKKSPAPAENMQRGTGPVCADIDLRGRKVRIAVAICMDYLRHEEEARSQRVDLLCIPAHTGNLDPFRPDAPRDHVRLLANCAQHGGSAIIMAGLRGPLTDDLGTLPLKSGHEGVVIAEFTDKPASPNSLNRVENTLVHRAELIERTQGNATALEALAKLRASDWTGSADVLEGWIKEIPPTSPFNEALTKYLGHVLDGIASADLLAVARGQIVVQPGAHVRSIRHEQATLVATECERRGQGFGHALDRYRELAEELAGVAKELAEPNHPALPDNVVQLHQPVDLPPSAPPSPVSAALTDGTLRLLKAVTTLARVSSPNELLICSFSCLPLAEVVAEDLAALKNDATGQEGFLWHNDLGAAIRHLQTLQRILPTDERTARTFAANPADREDALTSARSLHEAAIRLT